MMYDTDALSAIIAQVNDPAMKANISAYFSIENAKRRSVYAVLVDDLTREFPRATSVFNRTRVSTIIPDYAVCPYHDESLLEAGRTDFLPWTNGDDLWSSNEFLKYVWLMGDKSNYWHGVKTCDVGFGTGQVSTLLAMCGADVTMYEFSGESLMVGVVNLIDHGVEGLIKPAKMEAANPDLAHDTYIFSNTFYREDFCAWNVPLARKLTIAGKEVLVSSPLGELFHDTSSFLKFTEEECECVLCVKFPFDPDAFGERHVYRMNTS